MKANVHYRAGFWSLAIILYGCTMLAPVPDHSRFYVLASDPILPRAAPTINHDLTLGVGPVLIPQYLDRTGLATRIGATRVEYSSVDRWAEPLNECFPRVLARDLSQALGTDRVVLFPWNRSLQVDYQLEIDVDRFDIDSSNQAVLVVRWLIKNPRSARILASGSSRQTRPAGTDGASRTDALSQALGGLSRELADEVAAAAGKQKYS